MGQPPHTRYKMLVLIVIFYELKKCLTLNQDSICEWNNVTVFSSMTHFILSVFLET